MDQSARPSAPSRPLPGAFERCVHILALANLCFAQPLLDLLAHHAEFLVAHRFDQADLYLLTASLVLLVPLPAVLLGLLTVRASQRVRLAVHGAILALLVALLVLLASRSVIRLSPATVLTLAPLTGLLFAALYARARWPRFLVSFLAVGLIITPVVFLTRPQIRKLVSTPDLPTLEIPRAERRPPIFFIVFDEFSTSILLNEHQEINPHRYPHLAELAETSYWFPNAAGIAETSEAALPAILTGSYPQPGGLPTFNDYPRNLFRTLTGDYEIWSQEPMTGLCPPELNLHRHRDSNPTGRLHSIADDLRIVYLHRLLPTPLAAKLPPIDTKWRDFAEPDPQGSARRGNSPFAKALAAMRRDRREELDLFLAPIGTTARPPLHFLHSLLPHRPWEFTPLGHRYPGGQSSPGLAGPAWLDAPSLTTQAYQRYILQAQFLDSFVGRLVDRLKRAALFDSSLIVLVGDHGVSMRPGDQRRLISETNRHDIVPVPLLFKAPGQRQGERVDHPVQVIDLFPTLMDSLGIDLPWDVDGRSAFDPARRRLEFVTKTRGTFEIDPRILEQQQETVRWKLATFGDGANPLDLYRLGPDGALVGRATGELSRRGRADWSASIQELGRFDKVTMSAAVPVFVTGSIRGGDPSQLCCRLAIGLNGVIYGTTETHSDTGPDREFSVMLPYQAFREGSNELEVFQLLDGTDEVLEILLRPSE